MNNFIEKHDEFKPLHLLTSEHHLPTKGEVVSNGKENRYTIGELFGTTTYSYIYTCTDVWDNKLIAKVVIPMEENVHLLTNAKNEYKKMCRLRHPRIIYAFDAFDFRGAYYIIMERLTKTLDYLTEEKDFDGKAIFYPLAYQILQALNYMHVNNYTHWDVHQGNIFISSNCNDLSNAPPESLVFKLGDLGLSRLSISKHGCPNTDKKPSRDNWLPPPEIIDSKEFGPIDHRVDIFQVAVVLMDLRLGMEVQFSEEEIATGMLQDMAYGLEPPFDMALGNALNAKVNERTSSVLQLWKELNFKEDA